MFKSKFFSNIRWIAPILYLLCFSPLALHSSESLTNHPVRQELMQKASDEAPVQADMVTPQTSIQSGTPFLVGIKLKMAPHWKIYWKNPGDSGAATQIKWNLPEGFTAGPIQWPVPEKHETGGLIGYGYTNDVLLLAQITPPKNLSPNANFEISADVKWVSCNDSCVPGNATVAVTLPASAASTPTNSDVLKEVSATQQHLPTSIDKNQFSVTQIGNSLILHFKPETKQTDIKQAVFFADEPNLINLQAKEQWKKTGEDYQLTMVTAPGSTLPSHLQGVLVVSDNHASQQAFQVNAPFSDHVASTNSDAISSLSLAMALAFVGGMILNLMPCVLPVIALKIFSFVKLAQQKRSTILKHGAIYSFGVLASFWVLSGGLLLLRAYGAGIGWGFQLQEPLFVVSLAIILFLLGLSLFGVFELGASLISLGQKSSTTSPLMGSFFSGVLATLVATPCTGPLLGPALGFAITLSPISALLVFSCMGLGMAAPYLIFSAFPKLIRFLPKPGNWMITFKQIMGFLMMGTVIWLIWVFGAQTGITALFALLIALLVLSVGAWIFGRWGTPTRKRIVRIIGISIASLTLISGTGLAIYSSHHFNESTVQVSHQENGWQNFSAEKIQKLRAEGKSVFVDFTAKWCLICQANKVTLHSAVVEKAFDHANVVKMEADWTKNDPSITKELQKFGRTGVPLYVLYPADINQSPIILPQTLTSNIVADYLQQVTPGGNNTNTVAH